MATGDRSVSYRSAPAMLVFHFGQFLLSKCLSKLVDSVKLMDEIRSQMNYRKNYRGFTANISSLMLSTSTFRDYFQKGLLSVTRCNGSSFLVFRARIQLLEITPRGAHQAYRGVIM